jgi:hypothetical protein
MGKMFKADGDEWLARLDRHDPHPGVRALVFHCISNTSRGWRVIEVPADRFPNDDGLEELTGDELDTLFAGSQPLDYSHDPAAGELPGVRPPQRHPERLPEPE